jgi:mercuric ion binding protein
MKSLIHIMLLPALMLTALSVSAQKLNDEQIKVWGNCGMCKKTIETAAKGAGAGSASWSEETKVLAVSYDPAKTDGKKIQKAVADAGYDTQDFTAPTSAYEKLHGCCQYDRKPAAVQAQIAVMTGEEKAQCCKPGNGCCKDGKCEKGMKCCEGKSCTKEDKCCKPGNDCCKDGKCEKGKACCKDAKCGSGKAS